MADWKVYVCAPPNSGKNGRNFLLSAQEDGIEWKRRSARTPDRGEADLRAREWLAEIMRTIAPLDRDPTLGAILERHYLALERDPESGRSTVLTYRTAMRRLVPLAGALRASELDRARLVEAMKSMRAGRTPSGKPLLGAVVKQTMRCARAAWRWAIERRFVTQPWPSFKGRDYGAKRTKRRPYTSAEVLAVLGWIGEHRATWAPFFRLMAATGMRSSEVCGLRGRDVLRDALEVRFLDAKSKEPTGAPVPADVMDLLPRVDEGARVFSGPRGGQATPHAAGKVARSAIRALQLADGHLLDVHSFKRAMVDVLHRAKDEDGQRIDVGTAMRVTRHKTLSVHSDYQRNAIGHDVRAAQAVALAHREREGRPLTRPLTQTEDKPMRLKVQPGSPSNPQRARQAAARHEVEAGTPHRDVARKLLQSHAGAREAGEGWDGIALPDGEALAAFIVHYPGVAWLLLNAAWLQRAARLWLIENRPDVIPAPARRGEVRRG